MSPAFAVLALATIGGLTGTLVAALAAEASSPPDGSLPLLPLGTGPAPRRSLAEGGAAGGVGCQSTSDVAMLAIDAATARGALPALKSDDWGKPLWPDVCTQHDVKSLPFCDMSLSVRARAADVVSRLSIDEKQLLIVDGAMGVASLHLPGYRWWSEALHGVEGTFNGDQCPGNGSCPTSFPAPSAMGASFNDTLAKLFGGVIGREARALRHEPDRRRRLQGGPGNIGSGLTEWAPTINMQRDPRC